MSRIGKLPISIPAGVTVTLKENVVTVKGPKGELSQYVDPAINVAIEDGHLTLSENENAMLDNPKQKHAFHGLYRSLVHNMVVGVSEGFTKDLELVGIGFRTAMKGNVLTLNVGYSHQVEMPVKEGLEVTCPTATTIKVAGIDKQEVGEFAANVRAVRKPEPYKGKGIRYVGENIRRKEGKTAGKK